MTNCFHSVDLLMKTTLTNCFSVSLVLFTYTLLFFAKKKIFLKNQLDFKQIVTTHYILDFASLELYNFVIYLATYQSQISYL